MERERLALAAEVEGLRVMAGLTWTDVAAMAGCSRNAMYKALAGGSPRVLSVAHEALTRAGVNGPWRVRGVLVGRIGARLYRVRLEDGVVTRNANAARRTVLARVGVDDDGETWRRVVEAIGTAGAA